MAELLPCPFCGGVADTCDYEKDYFEMRAKG